MYSLLRLQYDVVEVSTKCNVSSLMFSLNVMAACFELRVFFSFDWRLCFSDFIQSLNIPSRHDQKANLRGWESIY